MKRPVRKDGSILVLVLEVLPWEIGKFKISVEFGVRKGDR